MRLDVADITARLYQLYEQPTYRVKFDFLPPTRDRVKKGFTYEHNMGKGRPPTPHRYEDDIAAMCAAPEGWKIALYPGNYGLACLDFDVPDTHAATLLTLCPPRFHTRSRSAYDPARDTRAGHAWYRAPSKPAHLTNFTRLRGVFDGIAMVIDVLYTQLVFIPAQELPAFLDGLLAWVAVPEEQRRQHSFPYPVKMISAERPGNRDSLLFSSLAQHAWHTKVVDREQWRRMLQGIDYFDDHSDAEFDRQFDKAISQVETGEAPTYPYTADGLEQIMRALGWDWRYNTRTGRAEFKRTTDSRFHSMAHKEPRLELNDTVRTQYQTPAGKSNKPWDPIANWLQVDNWITTYARRQQRFDPLGDCLRIWQAAQPLSEDESLILQLMDPAPAGEHDDTLRRCIVNVEKNMLLTLYTRIHTSQHDGVPDEVHFPYLPVLVGPTGAGKSRFCHSLAHGFHTNSITFDDPPKVFGETAQTKVVVELEELHEQLGRRNTTTRGLAKKYIAQTAFDYRAAHEPGATSSTHHLAGVLIGTSNKPVHVSASDGLYRRIIHLPVQAKASLGDNLRHWDTVCDDILPRAMARAAKHYDLGTKPRVKEGVVITWLHKYFERWRISDDDTGWEAIDDEFDADVI